MDAILSAMAGNGSGDITISKEQLQMIIDAVRGNNETPKSKKTKTTRAKDPNAPTRAKTPYMVFLWSEDAGVAAVKSQSDWTGSHKEAMSAAAAQWKQMSDEQKQPFVDEAAIDKKRYVAEMASYSPGQQATNECPRPPSGWYGPVQNKYIKGYPKDTNGVFGEPGKKVSTKFSSFEEAVEAANKLGDTCSGITQDKRGKFSLRAGVDLLTSPKGEISWSKSAPEPLVLVQSVETPTADVTTNDDDGVTTQPISNEDADADNGEDADGEDTHDDDEHDGDDDDNREISVVEIEIDGKSYYMDESTQKVFEIETTEHIGKIIDGKFVEIEE